MTNPDPNTMTLDECRDWLAIQFGWKKDKKKRWERDQYAQWFNPFEETIDEAAGLLPEGWQWARSGEWERPGEVVWIAQKSPSPHSPQVKVPDTGDEVLDRFRLAVACRMRDMEGEK